MGVGPGEVGGSLHRAPLSLANPLTPQGVVRVHLRGARDLRSKDRFMGGLVEGKSDPYAVLRVGTQVVTSRVIDDNLNPTWDEVYEVRYPPLHRGPPKPAGVVGGCRDPRVPPDLAAVVGGRGTLLVSPAGLWGQELPKHSWAGQGDPREVPSLAMLGRGGTPCVPPH